MQSLRDNMNHIFEDFQHDLFRTRHVPRRLFQYTDIAGLKGILESKKWRATHYRYLNDGKEIVYGDQLITSYLEHRLIEKANDKALQTIYNEVLGRNYGQPSILKAFNNHIYLASFSENGDLLDQWRAYAVDGNGYSIGIEPQRLRYKFVDQVIITQHELDLAFVKVIYDQDQQRSLISKLIDAAENVILLRRDTIQDGEFEQYCADAAMHLNRILWQLTLFFKHPAFQNEQEWRVVKIRSGWDMLNGNAPGTVLFRSSNNRLVPYIELDFSERDSDPPQIPITKVFLGPKLGNTGAKESLAMFLASLGYSDVQDLIEDSDIAYQ